MNKFMVAAVILVATRSAFAINGSLLDQALDKDLVQKSQIQREHAETQARPKSIHGDRLNAKYQVVEVGDEMGSFAAARKGSYHDDRAVQKRADAATDLQEFNAEVSDSTL